MRNVTLADCPVPILQNEWEFNQFLNLYEQIKPEKILEIGTFFGGTLWFWLHANNDQLREVACIDLPVPPGDERYPLMMQSRAKWDMWAKSKNVKLYDIVGNSTGSHALNLAGSLFFEKDVDMLFIDGDHTYQGVKADYENYCNLVKPGGMIVFHDCFGIEEVNRFWNEIKKGQHTIEFSKEWGIGILIK